MKTKKTLHERMKNGLRRYEKEAIDEGDTFLAGTAALALRKLDLHDAKREAEEAAERLAKLKSDLGVEYE